MVVASAAIVAVSFRSSAVGRRRCDTTTRMAAAVGLATAGRPADTGRPAHPSRSQPPCPAARLVATIVQGDSPHRDRRYSYESDGGLRVTVGKHRGDRPRNRGWHRSGNAGSDNRRRNCRDYGRCGSDRGWCAGPRLQPADRRDARLASRRARPMLRLRQTSAIPPCAPGWTRCPPAAGVAPLSRPASGGRREGRPETSRSGWREPATGSSPRPTGSW